MEDERNQQDLKDEAVLASLGYHQDLRRDWNLIQSFGGSFSVISVITGIVTLFGTGLALGGPACMASGWIVTSSFTIMIALAMAEVVSIAPSAGGPFSWSSMISTPKYSAFSSWVTGYFNMMGQLAVTTGISFGCAGLISTLAALHGFESSPGAIIGIYAAILFSHGVVNTFGIKVLGILNYVSITIHSLGVGALAIACLAKAPTHRTAAEVFGFFYDGTAVTPGAVGWSFRASPAYLAVCGILLSQYTLTGYDCSAHTIEETHNGAYVAPLGIITSVGASAIFGLFVLLSLLFSIQDFEATVGASQPVLQIFIDIFGVTGATVLMSLVISAVWFCGLFSVTSNSRMYYAFAREGALPHYFDHVSETFRSPVRAVWLAVFLSFCLALPSLGSAVAFAAATSIATIALYISYGIPIAILLLRGKDYPRGPFHLGKFSRPIGFIACTWIAFITIVFCLPQQNSVTAQTLNYTPVAISIVALWTFGSWFLWAHKWFKGPSRELNIGGKKMTIEEVNDIERLDRGEEKKEKEGSVDTSGRVERVVTGTTGEVSD